MKKCKRKTLCASTTNTAQLNAQHNKLHTHEKDHRFLFDHRWNGCGFFLCPYGQKSIENLFKNHWSLAAQKKTRRRIRETNYHD